MKNLLHRLNHLFQHEDRLLILIDADPDSIASALALKRLLWHRLSGCIISHIRPITRPQNERMVRLLNIATTPYQEVNPAISTRRPWWTPSPDTTSCLPGMPTTSSSTTIPASRNPRPAWGIVNLFCHLCNL